MSLKAHLFFYPKIALYLFAGAYTYMCYNRVYISFRRRACACACTYLFAGAHVHVHVHVYVHVLKALKIRGEY